MNFNKNLILFILAFLSCSSDSQNQEAKSTQKSSKQRLLPPRVDSSAAPSPGGFALQDFYAKNDALTKKVNELYNAMSIEERAAQMIMPAVADNQYGMPFADYKKLFDAKKTAGVLFLRGKTTDFASYYQQLVSACKSSGTLLPLVTADAEPSLMHYKFRDVGRLNATSTLRTEEKTRAEAQKIINYLNKVGVNTNFAPVADNSSNRAIIGNRSFALDSDSIVRLCSAFMTTHHRQGIATCIKHFPGHGNVKGDTHKKLVSINGALTEVSTFKRLIDAGALGVMVGHLAVNNNPRWSTNGSAATLSRKIVTDLLKDSLKYRGIAYTDAMNMGAVSQVPNASFKALCAGIDIVLMPLNVDDVHKKVVDELNKKGQYAAQFEESIKKIIRMKLCLGLDRGR